MFCGKDKNQTMQLLLRNASDPGSILTPSIIRYFARPPCDHGGFIWEFWFLPKDM